MRRCLMISEKLLLKEFSTLKQVKKFNQLTVKGDVINWQMVLT